MLGPELPHGMFGILMLMMLFLFSSLQLGGLHTSRFISTGGIKQSVVNFEPPLEWGLRKVGDQSSFLNFNVMITQVCQSLEWGKPSSINQVRKVALLRWSRLLELWTICSWKPGLNLRPVSWRVSQQPWNLGSTHMVGVYGKKHAADPIHLAQLSRPGQPLGSWWSLSDQSIALTLSGCFARRLARTCWKKGHSLAKNSQLYHRIIKSLAVLYRH